MDKHSADAMVNSYLGLIAWLLFLIELILGIFLFYLTIEAIQINNGKPRVGNDLMLAASIAKAVIVFSFLNCVLALNSKVLSSNGKWVFKKNLYISIAGLALSGYAFIIVARL